MSRKGRVSWDEVAIYTNFFQSYPESSPSPVPSQLCDLGQSMGLVRVGVGRN